MGKIKTVLLPSQQRLMGALGENIKLARLRRDLSAEQVAERAGIARSTLIKVEKGDEGVAVGTLLKVLFVLGLEQDLKKVAQDDVLGYRLQDAKIIVKRRAAKNKP
jgi:transcriptional regulator with XRE-family HTH domain